MSNYFTTQDIVRSHLPNREQRSAYVKTPDSRATAQRLIPEYKYNRSFISTAIKELTDDQDIGKRNQIVRGVKTKSETYATLQLIKAGEMHADNNLIFEEFLLQNTQEVAQEKYQLVETFGETVGFFFGSRPKVYTYSGTLLNTNDYPWRDNWKDFYEKHLRGTRCVEGQKRAYLTYDFVLREGYILSMGMSDNAAVPNNLNFNFTMFITREVSLNPQIKNGINLASQGLSSLSSGLSELSNLASDPIGTASKASSIFSATVKNIETAKSEYINKMGGNKMMADDNGVIGKETALFKQYA